MGISRLQRSAYTNSHHWRRPWLHVIFLINKSLSACYFSGLE
nr:MAG TPA: hypothetical protein [Caudoviricetes sp.]